MSQAQKKPGSGPSTDTSDQKQAKGKIKVPDIGETLGAIEDVNEEQSLLHGDFGDIFEQLPESCGC